MQVNDSNKHRHDGLILAVVCLVLQVGLAPYISVANGHINFAFIYCALVSLTVGGSFGVALGFVAGLVFDLCTTGPIGLMTLLLTIAAFLMGMESRNRLQDDTSSAIILFVIVCVVVSLAYNLAMLLVGQAASVVDMFVYRSLPTFLLTCLAFIPFAYLFSRGSSHHGSMGGRHTRHSGRYSLGRL